MPATREVNVYKQRMPPRRAIYAVGFARWCESSDVDRGREDCQHLGGHLSAELVAGVVI
jgi:hypothetical protein